MNGIIRFLFVVFGWFYFVECNSQESATTYLLTNEEKRIADSLQIDTSLFADIRNWNKNKIESFHYSLSKIITKDAEIEADPIFLKGLVFTETNSKSEALVLALKDKFKNKGYTIFMLESYFGAANKLDVIGVLNTTDQFTVLKQIGTDGMNWDISNDSLISILKKFDKKYALELIGASGDWCEFIIQKEPASWTQFAKEVYKVCPDVVDQGTGTVTALAEEMKRTKRLYCWWD